MHVRLNLDFSVISATIRPALSIVGLVDHRFALSMTALMVRSSQKIILHRELPELGAQLFHAWTCLARFVCRRGDDLHGANEKFGLPWGDRVGVDIKLLGQLG